MKRILTTTVGLAAMLAGAMALSGGAAVAANTVGSPDVIDQSLGHWDIRDQTLGHWDVRNRSLRGLDLQKQTVGRYVFTDTVRSKIFSAVTENELNMNLRAKVNGGVQDLETDGYYTRSESDRDAGRDGDVNLGQAIPAGEVVQLTSLCARGKFALSGGVSNGNTEPGSDLIIRETRPSDFQPIQGDPEGSVRPKGWSVTVENPTETAQHAQVFVSCARAYVPAS